MKLNSQAFGVMPFPADYDVVKVATLNKTDLAEGNNKYYVAEAHASKDGKKFRLYSRYGRVGAAGVQEERIPEQNLESLEAAFAFLLKEKTSPRKGYVEVKMATTKVGSAVTNKQILSDDVKKDKLITDGGANKAMVKALEPSVEKLVTRLYAEAGQAVRSQLSGTLQTTVENPLGTLTLTQIDHGKKILADVQDLLGKKPKLVGSIADDIIDLSNAFYSAIPQHIELRPRPSEGKAQMDEWLKTMALNNAQILDEKTELLDLLGDVQGMVGGFATSDVHLKYKEIGCEYVPCQKGGDEFKSVEHFMLSTRSGRHSFNPKVDCVWRVSVNGQKEKHLPRMKEVGNIKPLFHGTRAANVLGVSKKGLLLSPVGVFVTGKMFGHGTYYGSQSSKSAQYSTARFGGDSSKHGSSCFMFVVDVALGRIKEYERAQPHLTKPPAGYDSVKGVPGVELIHEELISYDERHHLLQYLIEFSDSRW